MRLVVIFFTAVWMIGPLAKAQDSLQAGFQAGFNQSSVIAQDMFEDESPSNLGGIEVGVTTLFEINEVFSFSPALFFSQKGYQVDYGEERLRTRFNYITIPVIGRINFPLGKATMFANIGPYFGWLLSAKESGKKPNPSELEGSSEYIDAEADVTMNHKYGDVGVRGGVGVKYPFGKGNVTFKVNYEEGFANIARGNNDAQSIQNKGYQIAVGYLTTIR